MDSWLTELRDDLAQLRTANMLRSLRAVEPAGAGGPLLRRDGRDFINLGSNDYLGLANHPRLREAAIEAIRQHGTGTGASRLVTGHQPLHARVEARFAAFKHAEAALILASGYTANLAVFSALVRPGDLICMDKLNHASLVDAARASGAELRVFPHLDYRKLERLLSAESRGEGQRAKGEGEKTRGEGRAAKGEGEESRGEGRRARGDEEGTHDHASKGVPLSSPLAPRPSPLASPPRRFIVTDSIFSMDGDAADLAALCDLADKHDAILVVDEAHATGVMGATGAGLAEEQGVSRRVDIVVSTASKALGGLGGIVTARQEVIDTIVNRGRPFIYTTSVPPSQLAAIEAAVEVLRDESWRRERLRAITLGVRSRLGEIGWLSPEQANTRVVVPIIPLVVGSAEAALQLASHLESQGFYAPAIRPPTVAPNASRVRITLRADMTDEQIARLLSVLESALQFRVLPDKQNRNQNADQK